MKETKSHHWDCDCALTVQFYICRKLRKIQISSRHSLKKNKQIIAWYSKKTTWVHRKLMWKHIQLRTASQLYLLLGSHLSYWYEFIFRNSWKFNWKFQLEISTFNKWKILYLVQGNPRYQCRLRDDKTENIPAEK